MNGRSISLALVALAALALIAVLLFSSGDGTAEQGTPAARLSSRAQSSGTGAEALAPERVDAELSSARVDRASNVTAPAATDQRQGLAEGGLPRLPATSQCVYGKLAIDAPGSVAFTLRVGGEVVERTTADEARTFRLDCREPYRDAYFVADDPRGAFAVIGPLDLEPGDRRNLGVVRPRLAKRVFGQVLDAAGAPVAGAEVRSMAPRAESKLFATHTDPNGRFELLEIDPEYVVVMVVGLAPQRARVPASAFSSDNDWIIELPDPATMLAVRCVDSAGTPLVGATVENGPISLGWSEPARTDRDGHALMPQSVLALWATHDASMVAFVAGPWSADDLSRGVTLELKRPAIELHLKTDTALELPTSVSFLTQVGRAEEFPVDSDGSVHVDLATLGSDDFDLHAPPFRPHFVHVEDQYFSSDTKTEYSIELERGAGLEFDVVGLGDLANPALDAKISYQAGSKERHIELELVPDADGRVRVLGLPAGSVHLTGAKDLETLLGREVVSYTVIEGSTAKAPPLLLPDWGRVTGRAFDKFGRALPSGVVSAIPIEFKAAKQQVTTDMEGRFDLGPLVAGTWRLMLRPPADFDGLGSNASLKVELTKHASLDVELALD